MGSMKSQYNNRSPVMMSFHFIPKSFSTVFWTEPMNHAWSSLVVRRSSNTRLSSWTHSRATPSLESINFGEPMSVPWKTFARSRRLKV